MGFNMSQQGVLLVGNKGFVQTAACLWGPSEVYRAAFACLLATHTYFGRRRRCQIIGMPVPCVVLRLAAVVM